MYYYRCAYLPGCTDVLVPLYIPPRLGPGSIEECGGPGEGQLCFNRYRARAESYLLGTPIKRPNTGRSAGPEI